MAVFCRIVVPALAAWLVFLLPGPVGAQTPLTDMSAAPPNGVYSWVSSTPRNLPELLRGQGDPAQIVGHLFLPPGDAKAGAVVLIHGSGGIYDAMLDYWPKKLNAAGLAVLSMDTFGPRGVKSTAEDQSSVPFSADTADAFAALRMLATHPRIDARRIAVMGFSRGGITVWRSAVSRIIAAQKLPDGLRFAAHVAMYSGGCSGLLRIQPKPGVFSPAPLLWVHGEADDYTPIGACRDYAERIAAAGTPSRLVAIPGAYHKFDQDDTRRVFLRSVQRTAEDCPLETDVETLQVFDRRTGQRVSGDALAEVQKSCAQTGAHVQGDRAAREQAADAVLAFLAQAMPGR